MKNARHKNHKKHAKHPKNLTSKKYKEKIENQNIKRS